VRAWLAAAGSGWDLVVLLLSAAHLFAPQRGGPLGLSQVAAPFLFAALLPFVAIALASPGSPHALVTASRGRRWRSALRLLLTACLVVAIVRFGPVWVSLPPAAAQGPSVSVTTWNLESVAADPQVVLAHLRTLGRGVVALEELARRPAAAIRDDAGLAATFPHQILNPSDGSLGMGLLSSYPILESGRIPADPPVIWALLDLGGGRSLSFIAAHPLPGSLGSSGPLPLPIDYDVTRRDAQINTLRGLIDERLAQAAPLIVAGDFNVTDREPAYADLTRGLVDAHLEVGLGPGSTWRPDPIKWLPLGILRIDMILSGNAAGPVSIAVDCTPRGSDHCSVTALVAVP
jgi:endonuclease/exonuclease/phosphatase (EEP) superfamily protein YafD